MTESLPPPIYSQQDPDDTLVAQTEPHDHSAGPHILIIPSADSINFQKGYLGAEGERASIEGELQIKGIDPNHWSKV